MAGAPKKSWKFLQKYWHKGAFFQDAGDAGRDAVGGDAIFTRDFSAPTGDDKMDKTVLPKVLCALFSLPAVHRRHHCLVCVGVRPRASHTAWTALCIALRS